NARRGHVKILDLSDAQNQDANVWVVGERVESVVQFTGNGEKQRAGQVEDTDRCAGLSFFSRRDVDLAKTALLPDNHFTHSEQPGALEKKNNADDNPQIDGFIKRKAPNADQGREKSQTVTDCAP